MYFTGLIAKCIADRNKDSVEKIDRSIVLFRENPSYFVYARFERLKRRTN